MRVKSFASLGVGSQQPKNEGMGSGLDIGHFGFLARISRMTRFYGFFVVALSIYGNLGDALGLNIDAPVKPEKCLK